MSAYQILINRNDWEEKSPDYKLEETDSAPPRMLKLIHGVTTLTPVRITELPVVECELWEGAYEFYGKDARTVAALLGPMRTKLEETYFHRAWGGAVTFVRVSPDHLDGTIKGLSALGVATSVVH